MTYRVTNGMMQMMMLNDMHSNLNKLLDLRQQMATNRKYNAASDNPNAVTKGMTMDTFMAEGEQYIKNLQDAQSWLKFTDDALLQMDSCFQRIRELTIQAGDGAYEGIDHEAIATELAQLKEAMRSYANATIGDDYLFAGLKACGIPFTLGANGEVVYNGNNEEVTWEFTRKQTGQVSITGREVFPLDDTTNYLKGVEVPIDFKWTGRNEILEFNVGWRTVKVRIPERWQDEIMNGLTDPTDYNRFRDPGEKLDGWSLDEIANLINTSTEMGDVSKLLKASVVKDFDTGTQYLKIQSLTGETVRLTGWPEEDAKALAEGIKGAAYGKMVHEDPDDDTSPLVGRVATADGALGFRFEDNSIFSVDVKKGEGLEAIATKINAMPEGRMWAAYKTDGTSEWIDIVSRNPGDYFRLDATGGATNLFAPQQVEASSETYEGKSVITGKAFDQADPADSTKVPLSYKSAASGTLTLNKGIYSFDVPIVADNTAGDIAGALNTLGTLIDADTGLTAAEKAALKGAFKGISATINKDGALEITSTDGEFDIVATGGLVPLFSDGVSIASTAVKNAKGKYALETAKLPTDFQVNAAGDGALSFQYEGKDYWIGLPTGYDTLKEVADLLNAKLGESGAKIPGFKATLTEGLDENEKEAQWLSIETSDAHFKLEGYGEGAAVLGMHSAGSEPIQMNNDHTHIGLAEMMGVETALKSTELQLGAVFDTKRDLLDDKDNDDPKDDVYDDGQPLHLKFVGGRNVGEIFINDSDALTLEELGKRINSVCGTWLQAVVETDEPDGSDPFADPLHNSEHNEEAATQRLVLRTLDGSAFAVYDGPGKTVNNVTYAAGDYATRLGIGTALMGMSTSAKAGVPNSGVPAGGVEYPDDGSGLFDENMPALLEVKVGERVFQAKVCRANCPTAELVAAAIVQQVNEQYGGTLLAWDANDIDPTRPDANGDMVNNGTFALYAVTGEPLRVTDKGYGDPRFVEYTGGVAMQLGIAAGVTSKPALDTAKVSADGTVRIASLGRTVEVPVLKGESLQTVANRIRDYAGTWLDVSFVDSNIAAADGTVRMSIAAKDGAPVTVFDVNGSAAWDFGFDTGLVGAGVNLVGWKPEYVSGATNPASLPSLTFSVNGAEHTIDLWDSETAPSPGVPVVWSPEGLAEMINTRFQGQDIRAEVLVTKNADGSVASKKLALWSPKGYTFEISGTGGLPEALGFTDALGNKVSENRGGTGPFNQNAALRTGDNQKRVDFFGVMDNLINTVEGGDVDGISDVMLSKLDNWMNSLLKSQATTGALLNRYAMTESRLTTNNTNYEEIRTNTVGVDLAEIITQYEMASGVYDASLQALARIMQTSLLDFLR